jgi:hypothetical protein
MSQLLTVALIFAAWCVLLNWDRQWVRDTVLGIVAGLVSTVFLAGVALFAFIFAGVYIR